MSERTFWPYLTLVLVAMTAAAGAMAQIVAKPMLLGSVATQPAAAPAARAPASQTKVAQPGVPIEKLVEILNRKLSQAHEREASVSEAGLDPDHPKQLRDCLAAYENSNIQLDELGGILDHDKSDLARLKASLSFYRDAQKMLWGRRDIGDDATRQEVSKKIEELQRLAGPLESAVACVDNTLKRERQQRQADDAFQKQHVTGPKIFDPAGWYGVVGGQPVVIPEH